MQNLVLRSMLFATMLLLASCSDVNLGTEKTDGGDGAAGTTGSGGWSGAGGTVAGSGGISGTGGVGPGTGGIVGTGGKGSGGLLGSGGASGGTCPGGACPTDGGADGDVPSAIEKSCTYDGKTYPNRTTWLDPDGCNECACLETGHVECTGLSCDAGGRRDYSCSYDGKSYAAGATFPATDGCNICECGFYWYRDNPPGPIFVSCTSRDCSIPALDAGLAIDGGVDTCVYDGKSYPLDTYFPSADGCDECHCRADGQITCTFAHISCHKDAGPPDLSPPMDSPVAPGCDVAAARAEMTARGLTVAGAALTFNDTLPAPISGPNWGLKSIACQDGGYDISSLAGQTVCLVEQPIAQACAQAPNLAWAVMSDGAVKCVYKSDNSTPGIYAVDGGVACP
jgi:hypothetical protein